MFEKEPYDAVIVGAGAAGVGMAIALKDAGIERFIVLERLMVGASFGCWPEETRFITPSFPTNSVGMLDINAVALGSSPAHILGVEHPTGLDYAAYLNGVAKHYELPVREEVMVNGIVRKDGLFQLETSQGSLQAKNIVWAAGEFQFPKLNGFQGSQLCRHTALIPSYQEIEGDEIIVIGGYESGIDAAYHLSRRGKRVQLFDEGCPWASGSSDPSIALSTYSQERMRQPHFGKNVELIPNTPVTAVSEKDGQYLVTTADGHSVRSDVSPLLAGGFVGGHQLVAELFEQRGDGFPLL
ncbi:MAG: NAD(P)-binding domain-containing protein, partial [Polyangiaceae bacterium]|nr:NAD(P)-binding domain-containing protein [Polyangiaceae bacterium]